jgi:REP element-mobilizing transposase RayT
MKRAKVVEREFAFLRWGGKREGAGRKRASERPSVAHGPRPELAARYPVHVTLPIVRGVPSLRVRRTYRALEDALRAGRERFGLRLVQFSAQSNHVHMLVEAEGRASLSRGMQGLAVRVARALNRAWARTGTVFADRYHAHVLRTPREVRNALAYVLENARKHGVRLIEALDPFSSGAWFDGWSDRSAVCGDSDAPVARARTWLLRIGWRLHGEIRAAPS